MTEVTIADIMLDGTEQFPVGPKDNESLLEKVVRVLAYLDDNHTFIGEEDISLDATTQGTTLIWPADIHDNDMFIVLGDSNGFFQRIIRGKEVNDLTNGVVATALAAATSIQLYEYGTTTARAMIGKSAINQFLIQSAAADTTGHVELWRFRKHRL